jgi:uncharacterized membrane protein
MTQIAILYATTVVVFLGLDAIGINVLIRPVFERHVGHLLAESFRIGPAALFYLGYAAGLVYLVSLPALREDAPVQALLHGMLIGFMCYGTYEFTNLATLADWSWQQVLIDTAWGTALTGVAAWAGVTVARALG